MEVRIRYINNYEFECNGTHEKAPVKKKHLRIAKNFNLFFAMTPGPIIGPQKNIVM